MWAADVPPGGEVCGRERNTLRRLRLDNRVVSGVEQRTIFVFQRFTAGRELARELPCNTKLVLVFIIGILASSPAINRKL